MNKKLNILFLVHDFGIGGVQKANIRMINGLDKEKFNVHVLYVKNGILFDDLSKEICIFRLGDKLKLRSPINVYYIIKTATYIKHNNIEIVHTIDQILYIVGSVAAKISNIKHVRTQPNFISKHEKLNTRTLKLLPFERWTHKFITYQYASAKDLNMAGVDINKIETIQSFIPLDSYLYYKDIKDIRTEFNIPKGNNIILAMHRMVSDKGYEIFIDMIPHIVKEYNEVSFVLVGDGPNRKSYEERVNKLGISKYVYFAGFRKDIVNIIKQIDFGIYPQADTAAMVETIISGKILITKKNSSMDEYIVDGITGYLSPEDKPEIYAKYAIKLLRNPKQLLEMEENQKQYVINNFDGIKNIKKLENIFMHLDDKASHISGELNG